LPFGWSLTVRRLASLLLSALIVPAGVVALPVVASGAPASVPVPASLQDIGLEPVLGLAELGAGPRTVARTGQQETAEFSTLGVTWAPDAAVGEVVVQARTRTGGRWTGWIELEEEAASSGNGASDAGPRARAGTEPAWVGDSDGVEVWVEVRSGRAPSDVRLTLVDPGTSTADDVSGPVLGGSMATAATDQPQILSRAQWGADESIRSDDPSYSKTIQGVTVHHTASSNDYAPEQVPGILRGFYAYHVKSRGWSDIGYNVLVDKFGTAWEGRAGGLERPVIGAHAGGFNTDTAGVSMIGTYESEAPSGAMLETVAQVAAWKLSTYHRDPLGTVTLTSRGSSTYEEGREVTLPRIFGHRDVSSTACPGAQGVAALPGLRERVAELVAAAPASPPPDPSGDFEEAEAERPGVRLTGWAIDPDASAPTQIAVSIDGSPVTPLTADRSRPDIEDKHPAYGRSSGLDAVVEAAPGRRLVCLSAVNQADGQDTALGCKTVLIEKEPAAPPPRTSERSCPAGSVPPAGFEDTRGNAHARSIDCVVWWELARGLTSKQYAPGKPVIRAHMATFLARLVVESGGSLPSAPPDAFDDDDSTGTHELAINQLAAVGVVKGKGGRSFDPHRFVTRDQMATFLVAALERRTGRSLEQGEDYFDDDNGNLHEPSINKVAHAGVTGGSAEGRYAPTLSTDRAQMASFLSRALDLLIDQGDTRQHA
jgi:hypothetical protein